MNKTFRDIYGKKLSKTKEPYQEPVFLFTSCSLRFAAYAGWYSAFGDKDKTKEFIHQAHTEWAKELGAGRRFDFFDRHNHDMWKYIPEKIMKNLVNKFFKDIKIEIKKGKAREKVSSEKV